MPIKNQEIKSSKKWLNLSLKFYLTMQFLTELEAKSLLLELLDALLSFIIPINQLEIEDDFPK